MDFLKKIEKETKRLAEDAKKNINKASNHHRGLGGSKSFRGTGESLGGSQPGIILSVSLPDPGPLGIKVEKRKDSKTAIVAQVVAGTQAAAARNESFRERDHLVGGERKGAPRERGGLVDEQRPINIIYFYELWFRDRGCTGWCSSLRL